MAGSTSIVKEKKRRSDMGYFDGLFRNLSPIRFQEVNWSRQGYANVSSAQTSIYSAMTTRKLNGIHAKKVGDRLFVYSDNFMGVLPTEDKITLEEAFRRANKCLEKNPDIEKWPIPERLVPHYDGLTNFQIGMKMRDILKEKYPYLTITPYDKHGFSVSRDKSYGSVCGASEANETKTAKVPTKTEPPVVITEEVAKKDIPVVNEVAPSNDDVLVRIETRTGDNPLITAIPEIPFEMASDLGEYLSSKGYEVNMKIFHGKDRKCYAILSYSKGA